MNPKNTKILKIAGLVLAAGVLVFAAGFAMIGFDFKNLSTEPPYEEKTYTSSSEVRSVVSSDSNVALRVTQSDDDKVHLEYSENEKHFYEITEENGVLKIEKKNNENFLDYFLNFQLYFPQLSIALPKGYNGELSLRSSNANMDISGITAAEAEFTSSNNAVAVKDSSFKGGLTVLSSNGGLELENVQAADKIDCKTSNNYLSLTQVECGSFEGRSSNGNIEFRQVSAEGEIACDTSNNHLTAYDVRCGSFNGESSNGSVRLENMKATGEIYARTSNNALEIENIEFGTKLTCTSSNGSIRGTVIGSLDDFTFDCRTSNGDCNLPENLGSGPKKVKMQNSNGNIDVSVVQP